MERVKHPDGVSKLMRSLWEKHQRGEELPKNNVYLVDLGDSITNVAEIINPTYQEGTLGYYINRVTFDEIISVEGFKKEIYGNMLLVYEAYDFLWSISPEYSLPYEDCKSSKNRIRVEYDEESEFHQIRIGFNVIYGCWDWDKFMQREIGFSVDVEDKPEVWLGALLLKLTDCGRQNIESFIKIPPLDESASRKDTIKAVETHLHSKRWYGKLFPFFYSKKRLDMLFNRANLAMISKIESTQIKDLIGPLYDNIVKRPILSWCVRQIKTHSKPSIAADSLNFALLDYDYEWLDEFEKFENCVIIFGSKNENNKKWCEPIFYKHFKTEHIFWYPYDYDGIVLTIIRYNQ